tara:strand:- start:2449 stop:3036 length:588 start_codon:yes stop_codon:yes gene_type:complete
MHKYLPNLFVFLDKYENHIFENNITNIGIVYRNYKSKKREVELIKIAKACKKKRYQFYVSNDMRLAVKSGANGLYLPSFNKKNLFRNLQNKNFLILGSAHNQKEIKEKILQNCKVIFLSPIFYTKKSKKYLNIFKFNFLSYSNKVSFLALGGINQKNIRKIKMLRAKGFAGITIFKKKPAFKRPVFIKKKFLLNL